MQIEELLRLTDWFQENVVGKSIPNLYRSLFNKMNANVTRNSNQPFQSFESEKDSLFQALTLISTDTLTLEQIGFLIDLNVLDLLGPKAVKEIESILITNNLDIAAATQKIEEFSDTMDEAVDRLKQLSETLKQSFSIKTIEGLPDEHVLMRVYFQHSVAIKNVVDFKRLATVWHEIGRGIALAQNHSPEDFKIVGAQKGSIIIEMAVLASIATTVSVILLRALKVAERGLEILMKVEELRKLKLTNRKIVLELKKEAERHKKDGTQEILDFAIKELEIDREKEGDKVTALDKAITKLIDFTQKGGAVDFVEPEIDEESEGDDSQNADDEKLRTEVLKLRENIEEIRALENKMKFLEIRNPD